MRNDILKYLGTVLESTAKTISDCVGVGRLEVARELNTMTNEGILERRLKAGKGAGEYVYWISRTEAADAESDPDGDGVEMHPQTLPDSATSCPKTTASAIEKPEVHSINGSSVENDLRREISRLEDKASVLQLKLDTEVRDHDKTRSDRNALREERDQLHLRVEARERDIENLKAKCSALQLQIDQYDERQRFETWFRTRPEEAESLKEMMWESWFERSKILEVA